jgi:drug/metabolite transporter (DMT)-like permease
MTSLSLALVLLSAVAHVTWNLLLKRSSNKEVFVWGLLVSSSVLLVPLGVVLLWFNPINQPGWWFILATIVLHIFYFVLLGRGYARADLSLVYPVARGTGPMLVPILAVVILREAVGLPAAVGIAAIILGIYTVSWWGSFHRLARRPLEFLKDGGTRYALLTGLTIAAYALVDKRGVAYVQPFLYMYLMTLGAAVGLAGYIVQKHGIAAIRDEWRANARSMVVAGLLTFLAYGLVLTALTMSRVSYVAPAREIGIVVAVLMGVFILKEPFGAGRLLGSSFIVLGLVLIALSP